MNHPDQAREAAPAMLDALLSVRPFVEMFHGDLSKIDEALKQAGYPMPPHNCPACRGEGIGAATANQSLMG